MNYFQNMFHVLGRCVSLLVELGPIHFGISLLVGVILAALCWWGATHYSRLFNRAYQINGLHHVLCAMAALLTLVFCVLFASLKFTYIVGDSERAIWRGKLGDPGWRYQQAVEVYYAIKARGLEDFTNYPLPSPGEAVNFPLNQPSSIHLAASIMANGALHRFRSTNPYLSAVFWLPTRVPDDRLYDDVEAPTVDTQTRLTLSQRAISFVAVLVETSDFENPKALLRARLILTACFLLAQAVPFLWIGFAAYRDLQVRV
jgi:hypothetical protein